MYVCMYVCIYFLITISFRMCDICYIFIFHFYQYQNEASKILMHINCTSWVHFCIIPTFLISCDRAYIKFVINFCSFALPCIILKFFTRGAISILTTSGTSPSFIWWIILHTRDISSLMSFLSCTIHLICYELSLQI